MRINPESPILSICIPTYNQPKALKSILDEIFVQAKEGVEIVIRDDSIGAESERIAEFYKNKGMPLRYFHGKKEGLDRAILFLTGEARGKYIWWFGDDMMAKGAIENILTVIKENPSISFIFLNSRQTTDRDGLLKLGGTGFFKDRNEVIEKAVDMLGFITSTIIRREEAVSGLIQAERYVGTAWVNLFIVLNVLSQEGRYYFIEEPLIISEPRDPKRPSWYDGFYVFAINFYNVVNFFKGKFSDDSMKRMLADNLRGVLRGVFVYRAEGYTHGLGSKNPKIIPLFRLYWNFLEFWKYFPILLIPRPLAKISYYFYKSIKTK